MRKQKEKETQTNPILIQTSEKSLDPFTDQQDSEVIIRTFQR